MYMDYLVPLLPISFYKIKVFSSYGIYKNCNFWTLQVHIFKYVMN